MKVGHEFATDEFYFHKNEDGNNVNAQFPGYHCYIPLPVA